MLLDNENCCILLMTINKLINSRSLRGSQKSSSVAGGYFGVKRIGLPVGNPRNTKPQNFAP